LVNFGAGNGDTAGAERAIPGEGEESARFALVQAMCALAAHPACAGGLGDTAGDEEDFKEAELAGGSPAVPSARIRTSGMRFRGLHRPAWSTMRLL
jgi:hypothetical protein